MPQKPPRIQCEQQHPVFKVADVAAAVAFYTEKLGFTEGFRWGDPLEAAGVQLGKMELHLVQGDPGGGSVYYVVDNANRLHDFHVSMGVDIVEPPGDRPYAFRDYRVCDPDGNRLGFGHRLHTGPPLQIEREAVPVRLEKRLAAVLRDLAAHKQMTVDECLEETLLHSFERHGDGVADPHGPATGEHIEELKQRHGLDYEAHAGYRFVEKK